MKVDEVIAALGLDEETAKLVRAKVTEEKAAGIRAQKELDDLQRRATELESELVGDGKTGARAHKAWYAENFGKIQKLQADYAKYVERYGALDANPNPNPANPTSTLPNNVISKDDFDKTMQGFTQQWSSLLANSGSILERHIRSGRKNNINWADLSKLATEKHNGNLEAAYAEWDAPEAEKANKAAEEARINAEVEKRMKARQTNTFFPSTEQQPSGVSPLSKHSGDGTPKYDRSKVIESAVTGIYEPATVQ